MYGTRDSTVGLSPPYHHRCADKRLARARVRLILAHAALTAKVQKNPCMRLGARLWVDYGDGVRVTASTGQCGKYIIWSADEQWMEQSVSDNLCYGFSRTWIGRLRESDPARAVSRSSPKV